ncbi:tryptophan--tRNA ligase [Halorussus salilacus]|uniref:tryptophan--tRNA ligase n=1 Tax=Halorussus salilacus TaxID=2953750 RepID=UPI00209EFD0E|nr:tryptophan--tRNA ligase [Halorussus salilacus]USZ66756.1 tryptophan--tRNA ligase [Halorussus salilacus]
MTDDELAHETEVSSDDHSRASGENWREHDGSSSSVPTDGVSESGDSEARRALPDGGTDAEGADGTTLDPWGSATVSDYRKLFEEFGIEEFDEVLPEVSDPHYLMRRGVIFGHRDYRRVAEAMANGEPFAALSGFMPTGDPHIGHKLVFDEIIWHQQQGGDAYALIADLEAHSARGMTWDEIDEHARDYLLSLLALGFDPEEGTLYRQSGDRDVQDLAFELGSHANFSELENIYGFSGETNVSHMQSVVTQMADILYPQLAEPKPTVIPVGPDQDPHVRLARDLAARTRFFGVTKAYASFEADAEERELLAAAHAALSDEAEEAGSDVVRCEDAADWLEDEMAADDARASAVEKLREAGKEPLRPRVRFLDRNATDEAFEALIDAVEGDKRVFDEHVDSFDLTREAAEELAREVELDHGGYGFVAPSSIYHRFMTGLTGGKMSSSVPASHISLLDDPEDGYDKVKAATTGGRETAEKQRELGGRADECPVYELYAYLLAGDDDEFAKQVYDECVGGDRLCGDCKEQAAQLMKGFLADHQEKREEVEDLLERADIDLDSDRKR